MKRRELIELILEELLLEKNYIDQAKDWLAKKGAAQGQASRRRRGGAAAGIEPGRGTVRGIEGSISNGQRAARMYATMEKEGGEPAAPYIAEIEKLVRELQKAVELKKDQIEIGNLRTQAATAADQEKYEEFNQKYHEARAKTLAKWKEVIEDPKWEQLVLYPLGLKEPEAEEPAPGKEPEAGEPDPDKEPEAGGGLKPIEGAADEVDAKLKSQIPRTIQSGPRGKLANKQSNVYKQIVSVVNSIFKDAGYVLSEEDGQPTTLDLEDKIRDLLFRRLRQNNINNKEINNITTATLLILKQVLKSKGVILHEASRPQQDPNIYRLERMMDSFYPYAKEQLGFDKDAVVIFESDPENAKQSLGNTGYYDPQTYTVTVYITDRHPKDIMRSVAHELTHHTQNCRGEDLMASGAGEEGYTQNDPHLRSMEQEAYQQAGSRGGLLFRDWEDGVKAQFMEAVRKKIEDRTLIKEGKSAIRRLIKENSSILSIIEER